MDRRHCNSKYNATQNISIGHVKCTILAGLAAHTTVRLSNVADVATKVTLRNLPSRNYETFRLYNMQKRSE